MGTPKCWACNGAGVLIADNYAVSVCDACYGYGNLEVRDD